MKNQGLAPPLASFFLVSILLRRYLEIVSSPDGLRAHFFRLFSRGGNPTIRFSRLIGDGMTRPATSVCPRTTAAVAADGSSGDLLLRTFTAMRDELVSTLCFVLGNADDAQDIAQEVFLRRRAPRKVFPKCRICGRGFFE